MKYQVETVEKIAEAIIKLNKQGSFKNVEINNGNTKKVFVIKNTPSVKTSIQYGTDNPLTFTFRRPYSSVRICYDAGVDDRPLSLVEHPLFELFDEVLQAIAKEVGGLEIMMHASEGDRKKYSEQMAKLKEMGYCMNVGNLTKTYQKSL